eukprot:102798-Prymnesium_polylepis.1
MDAGGSAMQAGERDRRQRVPARVACRSPEYNHAIQATLHIVASVRAHVSQPPAPTVSRTYVKRAVHAHGIQSVTPIEIGTFREHALARSG